MPESIRTAGGRLWTSIDLPVTKWLIEDHDGYWVGLLPSDELLVFAFGGPDFCAIFRYQDFESLAEGRTKQGGAGDHFEILPLLARALKKP